MSFNLNDPVFQTHDKQSLGYQAKRWLVHHKNIGQTDQTLETHFKWIRLFLRWCADRDLMQVNQVTRFDIEDYQKSLLAVPKGKADNQTVMKPITRSNRLRSVRIFFRWLSRKKILVYNPAADIELPKVVKTAPRDVLTVAEVEKILATCNLKFKMGIRNRAILETFYSTGIRRSELRYLKPEDIDFEEEILTVKEGKGGKQRLVPIGKRALSWIRKYTEEVRCQAPLGHEPWLFLSRTGKSVSDLTALTWEIMKKAGIEKEGACHLFRHTMATLMLKNGADIRIVQEILGHAKVQTTQRYTHLCIDHLKQVHTQTHPAKFPRRDNPPDPQPEERP